MADKLTSKDVHLPVIDRATAKKLVGDGWAELVDRAYDGLGDAEVMQVKEKFGALRIYGYDLTKEQIDMLLDVEDASMHVCELCGEPGELTNIRGIWLKTRCAECVE